MMPRPTLALACLLAMLLTVGALPAQVTAITAPVGRSWLLAARSSGADKGGAAQDPGAYIVVLADLPLAAYHGDLPGLAATSALSLGAPHLDVTSPAAMAYLRYLRAQQAAARARIARALGRPVTSREAYSYALNGLALDLTSADAAVVGRLPGVRLVQRDEPGRLLTDAGPPLIGAAQADMRPAVFYAQPGALTPGSAAVGRAVAAYSSGTGRLTLTLTAAGLDGAPTAARLVLPGQPERLAADLTPLRVPGKAAFAGELALGAAQGLSAAEAAAALLRGELELVVATDGEPGGALRGRLLPARGEGVIAGVIDTGINPFAPSFVEVGDDGYTHINPLGPNVYRGTCDPAGAGYQSAFPCNAKLIGAYGSPAAWAAPDPAGRPSPFDDAGHGSHTAATMAGNVVRSAEVAGLTLGPVAGVAPHAALIAYDVCRYGLCSTLASVSAIDRAVADGVAVINYSIGWSPADPWADAVALAMLGALEAGTLTAVSAGNEGPAAATIQSPANAPWVMAVGATSHARRVTRTLGGFSGGAGPPPPPLVAQGLGSETLSALPIVSGGAYPDSDGQPNDDCRPFASGVRLDGAIVVCRPSSLDQIVEPYVGYAGGAAVVVVLPALLGRQMLLERYELPVVYLDAADGATLLAWLGSGTGHRASLGAAAPDLGGAADTVAWFSSRGPDTLTPDVLKPDLAAPGLNVLAAFADYDPARPDYAFLSGTSMAAPHAAGAALLLSQIHPDWTPAELRAALMTTADPGVSLADATTAATPHDGGAGRVRVDLAARAGLLLDETAARFREADPAAGGDPAQLNLAALSRDVCLGQCVFTRTLRSALAVPASWDANVTSGAGLSLGVSPASFTLAPGAAQTVVITAEVARSAVTVEGPYLYGAISFETAAGLAPRASLPVTVRARASLLPEAVLHQTTTPTGSVVLAELRSIATDELTVRLRGLSKGRVEQITVSKDETPHDMFDSGAGVYSTTLALPEGTSRLYLAVESTTASDIDLLIFADGDGGPLDGVPQVDELVCLSASYTSDERCDLLLAPGPARQMIVLVHNYTGSGAALDTVGLLINVVPGASTGGMTVSGPAAVAAGQAYSLRLDWSLPDGPEVVGLYQGMIELSSRGDPGSAGDLGRIPVDLAYMREMVFAPLVSR
ncbi:MAG: S8 family serine peptidase [Chloroflexales bacterium]|nr:S8 family serine peptidase [Chloroflexales bacterium]